jgi:hypothetical protein
MWRWRYTLHCSNGHGLVQMHLPAFFQVDILLLSTQCCCQVLNVGTQSHSAHLFHVSGCWTSRRRRRTESNKGKNHLLSLEDMQTQQHQKHDACLSLVFNTVTPSILSFFLELG